MGFPNPLIGNQVRHILIIFSIFLISLTIISCSKSSDDSKGTAPVIAEVTKVTTPTNDTTPNYTFSSTETGTISYGGSCSSSNTIAISGNNTITLDSLSDGTYSDCIIVVRGTTGNLSNTLTLTTFIVNTTTPTISSIYPTDNQSGVSISDNISVTFSEAMDTTSFTTNTSNTTCSGSLQLSSDNFSSCFQVSSSPSNSNSDKTYTVDPSGSLLYSTSYKIRVTTGVKDTAGNTLSSQYETSSGFTTTGLFVTVGESGTILTSPDGTTWTERTSGTSIFLIGVTYGNGLFVSVGDSGTILTSPDGTTWTERTFGTYISLSGVTSIE